MHVFGNLAPLEFVSSHTHCTGSVCPCHAYVGLERLIFRWRFPLPKRELNFLLPYLSWSFNCMVCKLDVLKLQHNYVLFRAACVP